MSQALPIGVPVTDLRPTQMTIGFREVEVKRRQWREADEEERVKLLRRHVVPAVLGPKGRYFIVDHHHFTKALLDEKAPLVAVFVVADLDHLPKEEFWAFLDNSDWCHAYDAEGARRALSDIPKSLSDLADDPYRSLVGELIRAGGCAKSNAPFFEFLMGRLSAPPHQVSTGGQGFQLRPRQGHRTGERWRRQEPARLVRRQPVGELTVKKGARRDASIAG